ncbi:lung seven transmembrane receptor family protein [Actinidia rufa]|uniref:Lung seven transmembrane receptor family protein n=1 Tax=Actinidia rufa TaxID=165716 RepID=A0A7J0E8D3_9ERIC|nr:lung seven transmembrane receptor family protein [Actinidia rufa]
MQSKTGLVEPIIVEDGSCNVGEVIIHKNLDNPERPKRIQTFFEGNNQEAKMGYSNSGKNCVEEPRRCYRKQTNGILGITLWAVTVSAVKKTRSRLLLLVVSMGYGVVKQPTHGGVTSRVLLLGLIYFVASEALELFKHLDFSGKAKIYLMRKRLAKLELYQKFTNSLAVFLLLSIAWIGYELYFNASDPLSDLWKISWVIPAFWTLLALSLLVVICVLWAPSSNPTRYLL